MTINNIIYTANSASFNLDINGVSHKINFGINASKRYITTHSDFAVSAVLLIAMKTGENIDLSGASISDRYLKNIQLIQDKLVSWFPDLSKIELTNYVVSEEQKTLGDSVGLFFSGGVDSFDALLNNQKKLDEKQINTLVTIHGFDIRSTDTELFEQCRDLVDKVAQELSLDTVYVTTNLRELTEKYIGWDYQVGLALASVGQLLDHGLNTMYIASTVSNDQLEPYGSHPDLDPLFSNDQVQFIHYGAERNRFDKIAQNIAFSDIALYNLRICWLNAGNKLNCGKCGKCICTKIALFAFGKLDKAATFDAELGPEILEKLKIQNPVSEKYYLELVAALGGDSQSLEIKEYITNAVTKYRQTIVGKKLHSFQPKNILFVDFNGVISQNNFWYTLSHAEHELHHFHEQIETFLFKENIQLVKDWMLGKYSSEEIHNILEEKLGVPFEKLYPIFVEETSHIDISTKILDQVKELRSEYVTILITDNMDSFDRLTLKFNPILTDAFDEIHNSYNIKQFKAGSEGKYFKETIGRHGAVTANCLLIDDSAGNCKLFEQVGGQAFCSRGEQEALASLEKIKTRVATKWQWQY
jgi:FMN phosphatase YigB (HAD superfamily)